MPHDHMTSLARHNTCIVENCENLLLHYMKSVIRSGLFYWRLSVHALLYLNFCSFVEQSLTKATVTTASEKEGLYRPNVKVISDAPFIHTMTHTLPVGERGIVMTVSVCLSVCLHTYLTNHTSELFGARSVHVAVGCGSVFLWLRFVFMLCTSGFVDDRHVTFQSQYFIGCQLAVDEVVFFACSVSSTLNTAWKYSIHDRSD